MRGGIRKSSACLENGRESSFVNPSGRVEVWLERKIGSSLVVETCRRGISGLQHKKLGTSDEKVGV